MGDLILSFIKYGGLLTFVVLQSFSFYLVVQYNQKQEKIFFSSFYRIVGTIDEAYDDLVAYINLQEVADDLAEENARLRGQLADAKYRNYIEQDSASVRLDSIEQHYQYIAAKVISNSVNRNNNIFRINRGTKHGIRKHMGVISENGIVGVVRSTTPHYSQVMSLLHRQSRVSAAIKRNNYFGSLMWKETNPQVLTLEDIQEHAKVQKGDTIQTSGYSMMFPAGLMIGEVDTFWIKPGSDYYEIKVKLSNNLSNIQYVYVVKDLLKSELEELEKEFDNE